MAKVAGTEKVTTAMSLEKMYLVNEYWFWNSIDYWKWQDEENYPLQGLPVYKSPPEFDIREELPWDEESLEGISEDEEDDEEVRGQEEEEDGDEEFKSVEDDSNESDEEREDDEKDEDLDDFINDLLLSS